MIDIVLGILLTLSLLNFVVLTILVSLLSNIFQVGKDLLTRLKEEEK